MVNKAIYGMLVASLLWYEKFCKDLEGFGFEFNPYDPCVANKMVNGNQHTIRFHVDDVMSSHMDPKVNDEFHDWLNQNYGSLGEVSSLRGKKHDYLGMNFDFSIPGHLVLDMIPYVKAMCDDFEEESGIKLGKSKVPAPANLLDRGKGPKVDSKLAELYHTYVMKAMYLCKRARPDIEPSIAILCTRVKDPIEDDWRKFLQMMKYLNATKTVKKYMSIDNPAIVKWYVDASYAVHPDFKSHTGGVMTQGNGSIITVSRKQKMNTTSSTEAELVATHDCLPGIMWTLRFLEAQGTPLQENILFQDNQSTILLENNGKKSSSRRTRHFHIRYFYLTDLIEKGEVQVKYCPTEDMLGDYMTKPLQGELFEKHFKSLMGSPPSGTQSAQECVGGTGSPSF